MEKWSQQLNLFFFVHISPMHRTKNFADNSSKGKANNEQLSRKPKWWRPLPLLSKSELFQQQPTRQWSDLGARECDSDVLSARATSPKRPSPICVQSIDRATTTQPASPQNTSQRVQKRQSPKKRKGAQNMTTKKPKRYTT